MCARLFLLQSTLQRLGGLFASRKTLLRYKNAARLQVAIRIETITEIEEPFIKLSQTLV